MLQELALVWLLDNELMQGAEMEHERMKYTLLASNPQLYDQLYKEEDPEEIDDSEVEWMVPESAEEIDDIIATLEQIQTQNEQGI
jgi:hypothetical protein